MLLGLGTALQGFPGLLLAGPGLLYGAALWRRAPGGPCGRLLLGAGLALLAVGLVSAGVRPGIYGQFLRNTSKHAATWAENRLGLVAIVDDTFAAAPATEAPGVPVAPPAAQQARPPAPDGMRRVVLFTGEAALFLLFAAVVLGGVRDWQALSLAAFLPLVAFPLSSYYGTVLVGLAPLVARRPRWALSYVGLAVLTQVMVLAQAGQIGAGYYAAVSGLLLLGACLLMLDLHRDIRIAERSGPAGA